jgi:hypothetical protein
MRRPKTDTLTALHKIFGEVVPMQRVATEGGLPAIKVVSANGEQRTLLLQQAFWVTPVSHLLNIGSDPQKRAKKRGAASSDLGDFAAEPVEVQHEENPEQVEAV